MTTLERINDSLSGGKLNFMQIKQIISLYDDAHTFDATEHHNEALESINQIHKILDRAELSMSDKLISQNNSQIKNT